MASLHSMKQASLELNLIARKTRKREFLEQMERVVPWAALVALIAPYYPEAARGGHLLRWRLCCKCWTLESDRFITDPLHQTPGLNA